MQKMSLSRNTGKGKAPASSTTKGNGKAKAFTTPANSREAIIFCVPNMKGHYAICKGWSITVEKRFDWWDCAVTFPKKIAMVKVQRKNLPIEEATWEIEADI
ncbi:hypothetical protein HAX54_015499 [Datura stramonium]|uniref:Uncharacterized protein n=1 Tax=Datura stramonium TaxID=4076 RepID=A0ABS8TPS2_DATST|nr:hypothetical protein [Datura stramonium]